MKFNSVYRKLFAWIAAAMIAFAAFPVNAQTESIPKTDTVLSTGYYYDQLAPWQQIIYDAILSSELGNGPTKDAAAADMSRLTDEERTLTVKMTEVRTGPTAGSYSVAEGELDYGKIMAALTYDHEELSWLVNTDSMWSIRFESPFDAQVPAFFWDMAIGEKRDFTGTIYLTELSFRMTEYGYDQATASCDDVNADNRYRYADTGDISTIRAAAARAKAAIGSLSGKQDWEKVRSIHDWVIDNVEYTDLEGERFINQWRGYQTVYTALVDGVTVCTGYQKAFKLLCEEYGIPCVNVYGDSNEDGSEAHIWGDVYIDGAWYAVDCTNDDAHRSSGGTGYEEFLKGSKSFEHVPAPVWNKHDFEYPVLSGSDYPIPGDPGEAAEPELLADTSDFEIWISDEALSDTAQALLTSLTERRSNVLNSFGGSGTAAGKSAVYLYSGPVPGEGGDAYSSWITVYTKEHGAVQYGGVRYNGDVVLYLPDDKDEAASAVSAAEDTYTEFVLKKCGVTRGASPNYWYSWIFDGLLRYMDSIPIDGSIITADILNGNVQRPFHIAQIRDNARRDAYAEAGIGFIACEYGFDKIELLLRGDAPYEQVFGASHEEIADAWAEYVNRTFPDNSGAGTYILKQGYLMGAEFGTTAADLMTALYAKNYGSVQISGPNGETVRPQDNAATGMRVKVTDSDGFEDDVMLIVRGDVLGSGQMSLSQLTALCAVFTGRMDAGQYAPAGDWSGDGAVNLTDVIQAAEFMRSGK